MGSIYEKKLQVKILVGLSLQVTIDVDAKYVAKKL